jgi:hypothetical protein
MMANQPVFQPLPPQSSPARVRGTFLTSVLGLRFVRDLFAIFTGIVSMSALSSPDAPIYGPDRRALGNVLALALVITCVDLAGVAGVLSWKKWGVVILGASEALSIMTAIQSGGLGLATLVGLGTAIGIGFAIATRWKQFE